MRNDDFYDDVVVCDAEELEEHEHLNVIRDVSIYSLEEDQQKNRSGFNYIFFPSFLGAKISDEDAASFMFRGMQSLKPELYDTEEAYESYMKQLPVVEGSPRVEYELRNYFDIPKGMVEMTLNYTMTNACILAKPEYFENLFDINKDAGMWFNNHPFDDMFYLVDKDDVNEFHDGQQIQSLMYLFTGKYGKFKKIKLYRVLHDVKLGVIEDTKTKVKSLYPKDCRIITDFTKKENIKEIVNEFKRYDKC